MGIPPSRGSPAAIASMTALGSASEREDRLRSRKAGASTPFGITAIDSGASPSRPRMAAGEFAATFVAER
jgi:hypothetical protein